MTVRLSCPYCETAVNLIDLPATHRVVCPRCGETFAAHATEMQESGPHIPVASRNGAHPPDEPPEADERLRPCWTTILSGRFIPTHKVFGRILK